MSQPETYPIRKAGTVAPPPASAPRKATAPQKAKAPDKPKAPDTTSVFLGGSRPNSGRKRDEVRKALADAVPGEEVDTEGLTDDELVFVDFATARARKESAAAAMAELQYRIKAREYVSRTAVQAAVASALAAMAQTLRSIPDNVERKLGVDPETALEVGVLIDEAMDSLADELERMARDGF